MENKADVVVGVYYQSPSQDDSADELFYRQLGEISGLVALVLMGDNNWEHHTAVMSQSGKFLKSVGDDNFLSQVLSEPTRKDALLDFFVNREGLVGDVMVGVCLSHSDHETVEFKIFSVMKKKVSRVAALDFKRGFQASQEDYRAAVRICREKTLKAKAQLVLKPTSVVSESKKGFLKLRAAQSSESEDHNCGNSNFPYVDTEIVRNQLYQLNVQKSMGPDGFHPRVLKELVDVTAGPLSIIYQRSGESGESGEVPADWKLANVIPIYKKSVREDPGNYRPISLTSVPGKVIEKIILGASERHLKDNAIIRHSQYGFTKGKSSLTNLISFYNKEPQTLEVGESAWSKEDSPSIVEDWVRDHLSKLDTPKYMGPDGIHPRVLRELADIIVKLLSIIFERSRRTGEVLEESQPHASVVVATKNHVAAALLGPPPRL
ncbi:rna-directed dna polymerase from mobile element hypothetical protein [Limosa lapponica baueri]|uniref:Uncharacterized protein n=1 Tax=Limosa lapponica baueri TaxID=1758121 RepID=A0A2I0T9L2_LIMLA|nr:rna-directed dna polymerase from mobile element hypothetical protein [Limosa lapponica baueri]